MSSHLPAVRSNRLLNIFVVAGDVLWLQLLFVVAALPVITMFPAAVALQRSLRDVFLEGRPRVTAVYWGNLQWAWKRSWKAAILPPLFLVVAFTSLVFWLAANNGVGIAVLCLLAPIYGVALAAYLAVLAAVMSAEPAHSLQVWCTAALAIARTRAMPLALSIVIMATWFLLLAKLPTMLLVGTGLVPAGLAWWVSAPWVREFRRNTL